MEFALSYFQVSKLMTFINAHKNFIYKVLKYLILISAYTYVFYKIISFNNYTELIKHLKEMSINNFIYLLFVFLLLPINWLIEAYKWKKIVSKSQNLSVKTAYKSVLAGCSTGFFTPNRIGDMVGRLMFLDPANRKMGMSYFLVNSLSQNIAIILVGLPAAILFFSLVSNLFSVGFSYYFAGIILLFLVLSILLFILPRLAVSKKLNRLSTYIQAFVYFKKLDFIKILAFSLFRFTIFCVQFYFMLLFWGVNLSVWQALLVIPTNYLFITFTPSLAFSEPAIRSSYGVLFIGAFLNQAPAIAFAGFALWLINYAFPMLFGAVFLVKKQQ
jgi:hypothetical protein